MTMKIVVFGASGRIGQAQVRQLLAQGYSPIAITRHAAIFDQPEYEGVEVRHGDFDDVASLEQALAGADAVFVQMPSLAAPADAARYAQNFRDAVVNVNIGKVILNSTMWSPDNPPCGEPTYDHVRSVEDLLLATGLPVVVVRPVLFMDNLVTNLVKPSIVEDGVYRYCQRPGLLANLISMDDVARYMIEALKRDDLVGKRILLGGESLAVEQVVEILSDVTGKQLGFEYLPGAEFGRYLFDKFYPGFGPDPAPLVGFFDSFYTFNNYSPLKPFEIDREELQALIPLETTSFREWAQQQDWTSGPQTGTVGSAAG